MALGGEIFQDSGVAAKACELGRVQSWLLA